MGFLLGISPPEKSSNATSGDDKSSHMNEGRQSKFLVRDIGQPITSSLAEVPLRSKNGSRIHKQARNAGSPTQLSSGSLQPVLRPWP